ncbi:hypothetical protein [Sulfuriferula thiophila]|uniref:hypothetical protein n=1 Tax=Sulfuriferula thiophila TaxID=1781211 RepID=UPI000F604FF6|nr:hypothetical protein [Sulfuriferula thiophila]
MTDNPHLVYCKTAKGQEEIRSRHHGLLSRQRSALILMDCAKSIGIIANAIPLPELQQTVPFLMQSGFIVLADEQREQANRIELKPKQRLDDINLVATSSKPAIISPPQLNQPPDFIENVKHFMITTANTYLGLMGAEVISRIQRCHNADQLMAAVAHWHMALRDSKIGAAFAADFLEQVKFELHSGN